MTREVRVNLIFIVVLMLLLIPGFVLLMKKKLSDTSGRSNFMPEAAPYQIAYIQPLPAPPVPRKEPKEAREWVEQLLRDRLPKTSDMLGYVRTGTSKPPVVSDRFVTQLVAIDATGGPRVVHLLRWDDSALPELHPAVAADFARGSTTAVIRKMDAIDVPKNVRHALQDVGYVDPPQRVWWIEAEYPPSPEKHNGEKAIRLTTHAGGKEIQEVIDLEPAATQPFIEVLP